MIASLVLAVLAVAFAGFVFVYDAAHGDRIAPDVSIGGLAVGGMSGAQARAALQQGLVEPLAGPLVVRRDGRVWHLTAREAKITVNVDAAVDEALRRSRQGNAFTRTSRSITGSGLGLALQPQSSYSHQSVARLVQRVRRDVARQPQDARLTFKGVGLVRQPSRNGLELDAQRLGREVRATLIVPQARRMVVAHARPVAPKVSTADLASQYASLITVDRKHFQLVLYRLLRKVKSYRVAVGRAGLETPAGLYRIYDMQKNPSWHVPKSAWAGDLAGTVVPPGPTNPIKARWMGIYDGAGIHGTTDIGSLGTAASHGCVRMAIPDVIDLYDRVALGTVVYIV